MFSKEVHHTQAVLIRMTHMIAVCGNYFKTFANLSVTGVGLSWTVTVWRLCHSQVCGEWRPKCRAHGFINRLDELNIID